MTFAVRANTTRPLAGIRVLPQPARGLKKAVACVGAVVPAVTASPALALVDERLNGDGAGIALGINEPILGFVMLGVFTTVWILYSVTAKDFGGQDEEDGLSL